MVKLCVNRQCQHIFNLEKWKGDFCFVRWVAIIFKIRIFFCSFSDDGIEKQCDDLHDIDCSTNCDHCQQDFDSRGEMIRHQVNWVFRISNIFLLQLLKCNLICLPCLSTSDHHRFQCSSCC